MKKSVKILIPLFIILLTCLFFFLFRAIPVMKIWKDYSVLYVEKSIPEKDVLALLEENDCKNVISLSLQSIPLTSRLSPYETEDADSYLFKRLQYFSDQENEYSLFYIPDSSKKECEKTLDQVKEKFGGVCGMDGKTSFPALVPIVSFALYLLLSFFSRKRLAFALTGIFPVLLTLSMPFYSVGTSVCLMLLSFFMILRNWGRRDFFHTFYKKYFADIFFISSVFMLSIQSFVLFVLTVFTVLSSLAALYLSTYIQKFFERKNGENFDFVTIIPSVFVPELTPLVSKMTVALICALVFLFSAFLFSMRFGAKGDLSGLSLPSPVSQKDYAGEKLPSFTDFTDWTWKTVSYPYRSLNTNSYNPEDYKKGAELFVKTYTDGENGIEVKDKLIMSYDDDFVTSIEKNVNLLKYPAIEKLIYSQGRGMEAAYSSQSRVRSQNEILSLVLILISLLIPLGTLGWYNFGRKNASRS